MVVRSIIAKIILSAALLLFAQEGRSFQPSGRTRTLGGYAHTISGTVGDAGGPIAPANKVLLVRATDGASTMIWETETVPTDAGQDSIAFLWLAGMGSNYGEWRFDLSADGKLVTTFTTSSRDSWEEVGADGIRLQFETLHKDMYKDHYGFMRLVFPPGLVTPGKPVRLQITGKAERSMCWVMTYAWRPESGISASSRAVIMRVKAASVQPVDLEIVNIDKPTTATIRVAGQLAEKLNVPSGVTRHTVHVPPVEKEKTLGVEFEMGKVSQSTTVSLIPAKHWTVYLVQQTHTDIGYTRPQTEILAEHLRYIDYVLDYCDQTDSFPDDAKFRWTCETTWAVREYLKARPPHQIARLKKRIQEGRIEVTGMLLNWAEVADENLLAQSLEPIATFRKAGIPVRTAMQDDVNGFAWCLVDYFDGLGIKYVTSGINTDRSIKPFNYPTPFWWESPSGKRVLAYRGDIYGQGNFVNIHSDDFSLVERALPPYLRQLEADGYPYDRVNIQYNGYMTDNSPPSTMSC